LLSDASGVINIVQGEHNNNIPELQVELEGEWGIEKLGVQSTKAVISLKRKE